MQSSPMHKTLHSNRNNCLPIWVTKQVKMKFKILQALFSLAHTPHLVGLNAQPHPLPTFVRGGSAFEPGFIDNTTKITITGLSIPKFMPNSDKMANAIILAYQSWSIYKWSWYTKVGMSTSTKNWNMKIHNASAHMQDCNSLKAWKTKALKREGELSIVKKIKVVRWLVEE